MLGGCGGLQLRGEADAKIGPPQKTVTLSRERVFGMVSEAVVPVQGSFEDLGTPLSQVTFCVLDLETTGGSARDCEITEIGAARYRLGDEVGVFQTLVDPGAEIPPSIVLLTGITHAMVVDAPSIETALPSFLEFVGNAVIVGHNVRFDMSFLDAACDRLDYPRLVNDRVDTVGLARRLIRPEVRNLRLATLAKHFRSPVTPIHRALEDARATAAVLWGLLERAGTIGVTTLDELLVLPTAKGSAHYGKIELTERLPRRPGVYLFRDRHGEVIYVGKAKNLRSRVRSYFHGDKRRSIADMLRQLDQIDHVVCHNELEAEVHEIRLIHTHRPRFNRRSKPPKSSHFVKVTSEEFPRLSLVRTIREGDGPYLGPFRSRKQAELVMFAIWDAIPVRRCLARPGSGSRCAAAQMGRSLCPCDGTLTPSQYRPVVERLRHALVSEPTILLEPLEERMNHLAEQQRYEDAATARDRYQALADAIDRRRAWRTLTEAGSVEFEDEEGTLVLISGGGLVGVRPAGMPPPLRAVEDEMRPAVPPSVGVAEEAHLVWRWIATAQPRLVHSSDALASPATPVPPIGASPET
ncbi:MAG: DEDD exonuclease domain-containing protein [Acidimicrobiia bacterium]|nr:DEDD exonuclease domain-containing protein [Acidimicrobiia bacterium]